MLRKLPVPSFKRVVGLIPLYGMDNVAKFDRPKLIVISGDLEVAFGQCCNDVGDTRVFFHDPLSREWK